MEKTTIAKAAFPSWNQKFENWSMKLQFPFMCFSIPVLIVVTAIVVWEFLN